MTSQGSQGVPLGRGKGAPMTAMTVGHVTLDRYPDQLRVGGSAWYAARCFAALGFRTTLVASAGADFEPGAWPEAFAGLDLRLHREGDTTVFRNVYPAEGPRIQTVETIAPPVRPIALSAFERQPDVLFLAPVIGELDLDEWRAAMSPRLLAIGAQGWLKQPGPLLGDEGPGRRVVPRVWPADPSALAKVDLCCLSVEDLAGRNDLLPRFVAGCSLVAWTKGREGATLLRGDERVQVAPCPAREVDPTGAGDTFAAGLLSGLARGLSPGDAARLGAQAAAWVVEAHGGDRLTQGDVTVFSSLHHPGDRA